MHKIYYHKESNFTIIDVSGKKPIEKIREEFAERIGEDSLEEMEINEKTESYKIVNGKLKKEKLHIPNIS
jgi:hypothetical protein